MGRVSYLLDTNICIHYLNGQSNLDKKLIEVGIENCFISELSILEMLYGVSNSNSLKKEQNLERLKKFENIFSNRMLLIRPAFEKFSEEKTRLRKLGTPISDFDLLIASSAFVNNCILVSRNHKEMSRVEALKFENWID